MTTKVLEVIAGGVVKTIKSALTPVFERIAAAEASIAELKSEQLKFMGPHSEQKSYRRNDIVQRQGGAWICTAAYTDGAFQHADWKLLIKSGGAR